MSMVQGIENGERRAESRVAVGPSPKIGRIWWDLELRVT